MRLLGQTQQPLPPDDIVDTIDIPLSEPFFSPLFWTVALLLALLAFLGTAIWFFLQRSRRGSAASPGDRASERLRKIAENRAAMAANEYALALSDTLKDFFSEKFGDSIRYETTREFLDRASGGKSTLPEAARLELKQFLFVADEVKFGNPADADAKAEPLLQQAEEIVKLCHLVGEAHPGTSPKRA